ncbi:MAG TPA: nucleotide exchange factor GrpE [Myxococcota bacterium]|nr:nucleotide exchange factor GrpE [Myxococcota bacterium]
MPKQDKSAEAIDQAMREALASVERGEKKHKQGADPAVEVEDDPTLRTDLEAARDQLLRMAADFDNYRKRTRRDQDDLKRFAIEGFARDLLPVVDNLERALIHAGSEDNAVLQGVRMVFKQLTDALLSHGVKTFPSAGQVFDPERHEAVAKQTSDTHAPGTVLEEMQRGYLLYDRLLRPARVLVAGDGSGAKSQSVKGGPSGKLSF